MHFNPEWMNEALVLAQTAATLDEVPVGAVVVFQNQIIGRAYNEREHQKNPLAHAEGLAIARAAHHLQSWRLQGCILVSTLEPCPMCLGSCQQARIETIYYGASDPKGGAISLGYSIHEDPRTHHRFKAILCQTPKASELLTDFFRLKRRRPS